MSGASARLAVSVGCPCGIGPEVSVVAASRMHDARMVLVGDLEALRAAARTRKIDPKRLVRVDDPREAFRTERARLVTSRPTTTIFVFEPIAPLLLGERRPGHPGSEAGAAQLAWIDAATDLVADGVADALVTGPVSKDVIARSGSSTRRAAKAFRGHTEHLAARLGAREVTMAFWSEQLTTSLVTTHLPLARVPRAITADEVARAVFWTAHLASQLGTLGTQARVAVAALNPHAGEGGLLGKEEQTVIAPGIMLGRKRLARARIQVEVEGPVPAETAFRLAKAGTYAAVVAMYHDQATIPMKLLGFGEAVNVSLGLPIIRTSVDHGTGYDRAGKGIADARGMLAAMTLAARLAQVSGTDAVGTAGRTGKSRRARR